MYLHFPPYAPHEAAPSWQALGRRAATSCLGACESLHRVDKMGCCSSKDSVAKDGVDPSDVTLQSNVADNLAHGPTHVDNTTSQPKNQSEDQDGNATGTRPNVHTVQAARSPSHSERPERPDLRSGRSEILADLRAGATVPPEVSSTEVGAMVQPVLAYVRTSPTKVQPEWRHQRQARDASGCLRLRPASAYQPLVCVGRPHRGLCSTQVFAAAAGEEILHDSVTGLVGNVFGTVRAQLEQQQQEQPERQQRESASAPAAEAPRPSILDAVGQLMGSMSSLFGGGKQEQEQEQAQAQAQEAGAQNGSSPAPPSSEPLDAEADAAVTAFTARIFAGVREAGEEAGAAHATAQAVTPGREGNAEEEAEVKAQSR